MPLHFAMTSIVKTSVWLVLFDVASLTDTKQRLISKRGLTFRNPLAAYDTVRTDLASNKQRYQTKVSGPYLGNI